MNPQDYVRRALEQDAFALYCQPMGAVGATMSYPMAEVLVRLREEESSMLPPGEFFPVLEQLGMMGALDRWVVRRVLSRLAAGCRIPRLAINLSGQSLRDPSFALYFADELEGAGVAGDRVLFEVEENDAVAAPECMARLAATVASLGSGLIIEGFGATADPWRPLQASGVRFIKLNGALSRRLSKGEKLDVETATLLHAVKTLGVDVIADLVEDTRVLRRLKRHGVHHVQGYGIYRPYELDCFGEAALQVA
jgi:EAL domain-containing protein (putative c-di-GMP-specific phosphodiesterase class I)